MMRMLQLQSWFLESLDRRIVQCREKMGSVYEFTLTARAAHQQALLVSDEKPGAQHGAGAPPLARGPALANLRGWKWWSAQCLPDMVLAALV